MERNANVSSSFLNRYDRFLPTSRGSTRPTNRDHLRHRSLPYTIRRQSAHRRIDQCVERARLARPSCVVWTRRAPLQKNLPFACGCLEIQRLIHSVEYQLNSFLVFHQQSPSRSTRLWRSDSKILRSKVFVLHASFCVALVNHPRPPNP